MRINRHQMFMGFARIASMRSTCMRGAVGTVIVDTGGLRPNVVSIGYNGPASGEPHCLGDNCARPNEGCHRSRHAERNALVGLPGLGGELDLYTTVSPCAICWELITEAFPINRVFFEHEYRVSSHLQPLKTIELYRVTPSGYVMNFWTKRFLDEG